MHIQKHFGQILKEQREKAGFSQEELAFEAGCNRTFISMLERGLRQPTLTTLLKLGKALKMPAYLLVQLVEQEIY